MIIINYLLIQYRLLLQRVSSDLKIRCLQFSNSIKYLIPSVDFDNKENTARESKSYNILALNWRCLQHPLAGGAETNIFEQAQHWVKKGHNVTLFTADPGREYAPTPDENMNGVSVIRRGGRFTVYIYAALYIFCNARHFDVILDIANGIPFFAALFTWKPTILMVHHVHRNQWASEFSKPIATFGWFLESRIVPFVYRNKKVITVSPSTEDDMIKIGYKPEQLHLVLSGLNLQVKMPRNESSTPKIAYVGRLRAYKRLHLLIDAVDRLKNEFENIQLEIAGSGDMFDVLKEEITRRNLNAHITLHGFVSEEKRAEILATSTVFATPSHHEGWGLSVIEANAYGCPAVAYDVPGLQVAIPNNETGLLAKDDDDFVDSIARIIRDSELRQRLSKGALYWSSFFDWETSAIATLQVMGVV